MKKKKRSESLPKC